MSSANLVVGDVYLKKTIAENIKYNFKKASLKRSILIFFLKTLRDWIDPVVLGDAFQSLGAQQPLTQAFLRELVIHLSPQTPAQPKTTFLSQA